MEEIKFWRRIWYTIEEFPFKSVGLAFLLMGLGAAFMTLGKA